MKKIFKIIIMSSLILLPQCLYKKEKNQHTTTPIVNLTGRRLNVSIKAKNTDLKLFLNPYESKILDLPLTTILININLHEQANYLVTGIQNQKRILKPNRKIVLRGDTPKYFIARIEYN